MATLSKDVFLLLEELRELLFLILRYMMRYGHITHGTSQKALSRAHLFVFSLLLPVRVAVAWDLPVRGCSVGRSLLLGRALRQRRLLQRVVEMF